MTLGKLDGRTAIVTGASSGIGLATARELIAEGARVIVTGRRRAALDDAQRELGDAAIAVPGDMADMADLDRLVAEAGRLFGTVDIFVANAGVNELASFGEVTEEAFDRLLRTNVKGTFFAVQKALAVLSDGATVILTGSIASSRHMDGHAAYAATKGAMRATARSWAMDLAHRGIRVNVLSPGPVRTGMVDSLGLGPQQLAELDEAVAGMVPMGRWGEAHEIARAAVFLASTDSSFITGTELVVDGGLTQR